MAEQVRSRLLERIHDLAYQGQESVGASACHRIVGRVDGRSEVTLWVEEDRFLLRRLVDRAAFPEATEAARLREDRLRRRDHAVAAGVRRDVVENAFGPDHLLAHAHWPYARPREDYRILSRVAWRPEIGVPIDPKLLRP